MKLKQHLFYKFQAKWALIFPRMNFSNTLSYKRIESEMLFQTFPPQSPATSLRHIICEIPTKEERRVNTEHLDVWKTAERGKMHEIVHIRRKIR